MGQFIQTLIGLLGNLDEIIDLHLKIMAFIGAMFNLYPQGIQTVVNSYFDFLFKHYEINQKFIIPKCKLLRFQFSAVCI